MTEGPTADPMRWIRRFGGRRTSPSASTLLCFHHAGGSASGFRYWADTVDPSVEVLAVQLPGRADRLRERPYRDMAALVDALAVHLGPELREPFAFFGLSMGAKVCWTLAHRLRELGRPMPTALYLAGAAAPGWLEGRIDWDVADDEIIGYLRQMGGTPPEVLEHPELLAALLPTLRADLTLVDSWHFAPAEPLAVPIRAFAGVDDVEGGPERMAGWEAQTSDAFSLTRLDCGHFFDAAGEALVLDLISADMRCAPERTAAR